VGTMGFFNISHFIDHWGLIGIAFCIFAETGLFLGFFLPGESLLISAGIIASTHKTNLNVWELTVVVLIAGILGNQLGYIIGHHLGPSFRNRPDGKLYKRKYLEKADNYFARYGNRTILFARFVPIVRTFGPLVAGITEMKARAFTTFNIIGGIVWTFSMIFVGYYLGSELKKHNIDVEKYILPIIIVVVIVSLTPAALEMRRDRREAAKKRDSVDVGTPE
jgi:membrane-associated protein